MRIRGRNIHRLLFRRSKHRKQVRQISQQRNKRKFKLGWISGLLQTPGVQAAPWHGPTPVRIGRAPGALVGPLRPSFGTLEASEVLIFYWIFPDFFEYF